MRHEAPKPLVYLALSIVILIVLLSGLIKMCAKPALGEALTQDLMFADYTGGINHIGRGYLAPNEYLSLSNFLLFSNYLQVRKGYTQLGASLSSNPLEFMDVFATKSGASYLLASDGQQLWYRTGIVEPATELEVGRSNRATVSTFGTYVSGDTLAQQKWLTIFGPGEGLTITINSVDYIIDQIITDTSLYLTTSAGNQTTVNYNIDYSAVDIKFGIPMTTAYYIYSTGGRFAFTSPTEFDILDSLTGTRYTYTDVFRQCNATAHLEFVCAAITVNHAGKFLQIATDQESAGGNPNPITGTHPFYTSYPIWTSGAGKVYTWATAFLPDSTTNQYFNIVELEYDSTYDTVVVVDSIRTAIADSANYSCSPGAMYLQIYDAGIDSMRFGTNDWFCYPRFSFKQFGIYYDSAGSHSYLDLPEIAMSVFPVAGGFKDANGAIYAACPGLWTESRSDTTDFKIPQSNNVPMTFYRMKRTTNNSAASNYTWGARYDNRVFWSEADDPTFVKKSDPHDPSTQDGVGFYMFTEEGDAPLAGLVQGDVLKVYCENSIHIITSADGYLYTTEQVARNVGCSSPKTLREFAGTHYFLHRTGVYEDNGTQPVPISQKVNFWFTDSIPQASYRDAAAAIFDKKYWISFPLVSGGRKTLVYDLLARVWTDMSNLNFSAATTYGRGPDSLQFLFSDPDSGAVLSYFGNLDRGDSIVAVIQTDYVDAGAPEKNKIWRMAQVAWDNAASATMTMDFFLDPAQSSYHTYSFLGSTFGTERINPPSLLGRVCSFKLTIDGAAGYKHRLIKVGVIDKGFAP